MVLRTVGPDSAWETEGLSKGSRLAATRWFGGGGDMVRGSPERPNGTTNVLESLVWGC
jgi:hypothetical protein